MWLSPGLDCTTQGQELYSALLWVHSIYPVWSLPSASHHCCSVAKLSPILCDPKDCSTPVSPSLTISLSLLRFMSPAEKEMATHSTILAWRILWTGEPGGLLSMGLHRVRHDWSNLAEAAAVTLLYKQFPCGLKLILGGKQTVYQSERKDGQKWMVLTIIGWPERKDCFRGMWLLP